MSYLRMFGLLLVVGTVMAAFAGPASATFTVPTGTTLATGSTIAMTSGTIYFTGPWSDIECKHSEIKGTLTSNGTTAASISLSTLDFSNCNYEITVEKRGELVATTTAKGTASVKSVGLTITLHTSVGACTIATGSGVPIAGLVDSHHTKGTAKLEINSKIPVEAGSFFCGSSAEWEGTYTVTNPDGLYID